MTDESTAYQAKGPLVVIGSSAGGIEALTTLLASIDPKFPAPIVIAQHLDPQRPSSLALVLERRSVLPIILVEGSTKMEPAHVYIVPANRHITIQDGHVAPEADHPHRPRPSVDLLLTTAADQYGDKLTAVVLTGAGSDGASGALEVKRHGGTVVIQNPATARFPSMPLALPPTAVDHVVDLENLGGLLGALVTGVEIPVSESRSDDGLREILTLVSGVAGVDFTAYKQSTILRRIARRMVFTHQTTLEDYRKYLDQHREEIQSLAMTFLIKVTEFFRDEDAFDFLRDRVLPILIERARTRGRTLRLWSAGCATGEEPYSIAMMLADMLGPELHEWNIKIFATDLDESSIGFARRGLYPDKVLAKLPEAYRERFFDETDSGLQVSKMLRQMVIFGQQDLSRGVPFPRTDLVVCRNLLIYFKPELQHHVLDLFAYSLSHSGGYLFLGKAETARPSNTAFELIDKRWKVYRCTKLAVPSSRRAQTAAAVAPFLTEHRVRRAEARVEGALPDSEAQQLRRFNDLLLRMLPIGIAVVDRAYHLVTINNTARRLLGVREVGQEQDFLHAVRGLPYGAVRDAIDNVFRDRGVINLSELALERVGSSEPRYLSLCFAHADNGGQEAAVVSVTDATEVVQARRALENIQSEQARLVAELTTANKRFTEINKDLQDANEELQATNEEMTLAQEELQASNEELEATNEELQATNEELETNNEELQATNEELEATNEELTARSQELQEVARTLSAERVRLTELIDGAPVHVLMLRGPTLLVEVANPRFVSVLGEGRDWANRPVEEVLSGEQLAPLIGLIREAYWNNRSGRGERVAFGDRVLTVDVIPSHDTTGRVEGVVVFASDA